MLSAKGLLKTSETPTWSLPLEKVPFWEPLTGYYVHDNFLYELFHRGRVRATGNSPFHRVSHPRKLPQGQQSES